MGQLVVLLVTRSLRILEANRDEVELIADRHEHFIDRDDTVNRLRGEIIHRQRMVTRQSVKDVGNELEGLWYLVGLVRLGRNEGGKKLFHLRGIHVDFDAAKVVPTPKEIAPVGTCIITRAEGAASTHGTYVVVLGGTKGHLPSGREDAGDTTELCTAMAGLIADLTDRPILQSNLASSSTDVRPIAHSNFGPTRLEEFVVLGALLELEGRRGILLTACDAVGAGLLPSKAGTNAGGGILTSAGPLSTDIALGIGTVSGDEACANTRAFIASTRCLDLLNLSGTPNPSEETIAIDENMVGPEFFGTAGLGVHIARLVLGEEGTRSGLKATTILPVTRRLALKVGILPAEVDGVAPLQRITGSLAASLIKTDHGVSGLVNRSARGGEAVEFVRYLVVSLGARRFNSLGIRDGTFVGSARIKEARNLGGGLVGTLDAGKKTVTVGNNMLRIELGGTAGFGVDVTRLVFGEERAGGSLEITTVLPVARRLAPKVGILPAEVDGIASLQRITGSLAASLIKTDDGVSGLVNGGTGRGKAVALIGDLVVLVNADGLLLVGLLVEIRAVDGNIVRCNGLDLRSGGRRFGLDGALHGGEEAVGVGKDLVGPGGVGATCLGVDIASRTEGQGTGGRIEVSAGAEVTGRPALVCGIPPAVLDGVATGKAVACGLAGGLVEIEEGLGDAGTVDRRAGGRLPIEFVGEFVVPGGAGLWMEVVAAVAVMEYMEQ